MYKFCFMAKDFFKSFCTSLCKRCTDLTIKWILGTIINIGIGEMPWAPASGFGDESFRTMIGDFTPMQKSALRSARGREKSKKIAKNFSPPPNFSQHTDSQRLVSGGGGFSTKKSQFSINFFTFFSILLMFSFVLLKEFLILLSQMAIFKRKMWEKLLQSIKKLLKALENATFTEKKSKKNNKVVTWRNYY